MRFIFYLVSIQNACFLIKSIIFYRIFTYYERVFPGDLHRQLPPPCSQYDFSSLRIFSVPFQNVLICEAYSLTASCQTANP